jgi:hypothetical protein
MIIQLFIPILFFFSTTVYYRKKYIGEHRAYHMIEGTMFNYYNKMVDLDMQNEILKKTVNNLKLENSELRSGIYMGYTNPTVMSATVNSNGHLE